MKQLITLSFIFLQLTALAFDATKEMEQQFLSADFEEFRISNEYGNITFLPSTSDSITVKTRIVADVIEITDTSEIFRYIEIAMYKSKQTLRVKTGFDTDLDNATHVTIHYTVYLPDTMNLNIRNRYGNISLFDIYGTKKINLEYGKVVCNNILCPSFPTSSITLSFADFTGQKANTLDFKINNGSINLSKIDKSSIHSSFSLIHIKNSKELDCKSLNDKYELDTIQQLTMNGENTIASIIQLNEKLQLDFTSGKLTIHDVSTQFTGIDLNVLNAEATIHTSVQSNFLINALIHYGSFIYPNNFNLSELKDLDKTIYKGANKKGDSFLSQIGIVGYNSTITLK